MSNLCCNSIKAIGHWRLQNEFYYCCCNIKACLSWPYLCLHTRCGMLSKMSKKVVWLQNDLDLYIFNFFVLFGFVALIFEPLYYFGCQWNGVECPLAKTNALIAVIRDIWMFYGQWDPLFKVVPLWLQVMCSIEVFIFGPLYVYVALAMKYNWQSLATIGPLFGGALIYSTIVYFAMEVLEADENTNMLMIFLVNIPWTIVPILSSYRIAKLIKQSQLKN